MGRLIRPLLHILLVLVFGVNAAAIYLIENPTLGLVEPGAIEPPHGAIWVFLGLGVLSAAAFVWRLRGGKLKRIIAALQDEIEAKPAGLTPREAAQLAGEAAARIVVQQTRTRTSGQTEANALIYAKLIDVERVVGQVAGKANPEAVQRLQQLERLAAEQSAIAAGFASEAAALRDALKLNPEHPPPPPAMSGELDLLSPASAAALQSLPPDEPDDAAPVASMPGDDKPD